MKASNRTTPAPTFAIGDAVTVTLPDTPVVSGFVHDKTATGWFIVQLDDASLAVWPANDKRLKDARISTRAKSMTAHLPSAPDAKRLEESADEILLDDEALDALSNPDAPVHDPEANEDDEEYMSDMVDPDDELDGDGEEKAEHPMAAALRKARVRYVKTKRPEGSASADCGDMLAKTLRDLEPEEVAAMADKVLGEASGTHLAKYLHLNNGQIRMNSGNRIRAYLKTAHADGLAHAYTCLGWNEADEDLDEEGGEE